jgi:Raf kinase inhibitor-like YbhB/YbcL family protein
MSLAVRTPAFGPNQKIPDQYSRDAGNHSPAIEWQGAPDGTRSFAVVVEDPDAPRGTFRHWAAYDIPADASHLAEGAGSAVQGAPLKMAVNDFGNPHYDGPQPPPGHGVHHYHFRLFALDTDNLEVPDDSNVEQVLSAARDHALAEADTVGTFER